MRRCARLSALFLTLALAAVGCGGADHSKNSSGGRAPAGAHGSPAGLRGVTVSGPTANGTRPNPFAAPAFDLGQYGYTEQEFFFGGTATAYAAAPGTDLGSDGRWTLKPDRAAAFKTRMLVMRPTDPKRFSGTVWLSWLNVTAGFEIGDITRAALRDGDATVYVSAQKVGVDGVKGGEANGLRGWDRRRYGSLFHPGDDFSYDIFTKAALLVGRNRGRLAADPMAGFAVKRVFATGASQSAVRLTSYLNGVQPLARALDGALPIANFGLASSFQTKAGTDDMRATFARPPVRIRNDLGVPVILVSTETEAESHYPVRQPDTSTFRTWEIAGAAHAGAGASTLGDVVKTFTRDGLKVPSGAMGSSSGAVGAATRPNSMDWLPVVSAARHDLTVWASGGAAPPSLPLISFAGRPPRIQRDRYGNALGGIRMPELQVPLAVYRGSAPGTDAMTSLFGSMTPFPADRLRQLYPSRQAYLAAYGRAVDAGVAAGFFLARDAPAIKAAAAASAAQLLPT